MRSLRTREIALLSKLAAVTPFMLALISAGALAWVIYFRSKDRLKPEPGHAIAWALGAGVLSALLALGGF